MSEQLQSNEIQAVEQKVRFAGLPYEKAVEVAQSYLQDEYATAFLAIYLENDKSAAIVAEAMGQDAMDAGTIMEQLEIKIAQTHLANIPRGYGHAAGLLLLQGGKTSA